MIVPSDLSPLLALALACSFALPSPVGANDNGLALAPPLGWRSWNLYGPNVNQALLEGIMEGMTRRRPDHAGVPVSLVDLGYVDVGLDDNWQLCGSPEAAAGMNYHRPDGSPIVNLERFPDMAAMVDRAHGLNLTAGWYGNNCICHDNCRSDRECEEQIEADVRAMVNFGFDSWKLDGCGGELDLRKFDAYVRRLSPKPVLVENCHWGQDFPNRTLPPSEGCPYNFYRSSGDIGPSYAAVMRNLGSVERFRAQNLSYPGCWAYPDMLEVGVVKGGKMVLSAAEARSHFGGWCIVSSPLILSYDVTDESVAEAVWDIVSNREAIEVNRAYAGDSGGVYDRSDAAVLLRDDAGAEEVVSARYQYLSKPLGDGRGAAVLLMNSADEGLTLNATFRDVPGLPGCEGDGEAGDDEVCNCHVRDIWAHEDRGLFVEVYGVEVGLHDAAFLLVTDCKTGDGKKVVVRGSQSEETVAPVVDFF